MKVDIELTRSSDAEDLARALTAHGIPTEVLREPDRVTATTEDMTQLEHAVEDWTAERGLPFVPQHVDGQRLVLSPPGS